ncbi:MAG: glycine oxidase [Crocinitomicaceae bacterium]|jgi:glycine oxidase
MMTHSSQLIFEPLAIMSEPRKFLVIGAGLAGLSVAIQLLRKGARVTVLDNQVNFSSIVAAGMINPIVFRRMTKGWRVDEFVPACNEFYSSIETETGTDFFRNITIRRMFSSEFERELWLKKQELETFKDYLTPLEASDDKYDRAINPFGSGRVKNSSAVIAETFIAASKQLISEHKLGTLLHATYSAEDMNQTTYKGTFYDDIVFCEGYLGIHNPLFTGTNLEATKGETLVVRSENLPEDESLNRKCFNLPMGDHRFKIGSTIDWNNSTTNITEEGRNEILEKFSFLTDEPIEVLDQKAGVRPTTKDRRPIIGSHSELSNYHIFNGLGAKGYLLAPLLSYEFACYLIDGRELDPEVLLSRFYPGR